MIITAPTASTSPLLLQKNHQEPATIVDMLDLALDVVTQQPSSSPTVAKKISSLEDSMDTGSTGTETTVETCVSSGLFVPPEIIVTATHNKRCIFGDYWQANNETPIGMIPEKVQQEQDYQSCLVAAAAVSTATAPLEQEATGQPDHTTSASTATPQSPRRTIFGPPVADQNTAASFSPRAELSLLASRYRPDPLNRKTQSDSILLHRPPVLKKHPRYSSSSSSPLSNKTHNNNNNNNNGPATRRRLVRSVSVRFDERVRVLEYTPPVERFAEPGWSNFFANDASSSC
mmetsp:Transcript_7396/g.15071  ORF Transcript_7396/g.15071 Transcript_7396/m.15071 type:complete len:288 (-) Transcript_7396:173-1036(-)